MWNNKIKYQRFALWLLLLFPLVFMENCSVLSRLFLGPEEEEICDEEAIQYYDSLNRLKSIQWHDSCELVLQAEWDSILRARSDSAVTMDFVSLLADSIIDYARRFMGVPYVHGGNGPKSFDCSGFTLFVFKHFGYKLKRTVQGQLADGWKIIDNTADLRRGDLVFFGGRKVPTRMGHVAILVDNDVENQDFTFIHATLNKGITISSIKEKYYKIRYMTACRILPEK